MGEFVCDVCWPGVEEVGEVVPGCWLALDADGRLVLFAGDGCGHPIFAFDEPPTPEAVPREPGESDEDYDRRYDALPEADFERDMAAIDKAHDAMGAIRLDLQTAMGLVALLEKGGYDRERDGYVSIWLYFRCAEAWRRHQSREATTAPRGRTRVETPKTTVVHCKREAYDVYIGRPSKWGNPYSHKPGTLAEFQVESREEAVARYRDYVLSRPDLLAALPELRGKRLGCWCAPKGGFKGQLLCHGQILAELADVGEPS